MLAGMISDRQSPAWSSIRDYPDDPVSRSNSREFAALANGPLAALWVGLMGLPVEIELQHIHPGFTEGAESSAPIEESGSHMTPRWREVDSNPRSPDAGRALVAHHCTQRFYVV